MAIIGIRNPSGPAALLTERARNSRAAVPSTAQAPLASNSRVPASNFTSVSRACGQSRLAQAGEDAVFTRPLGDECVGARDITRRRVGRVVRGTVGDQRPERHRLANLAE